MDTPSKLHLNFNSAMMFSKTVYTQRRSKLKKDLGSGLILFLGNEESSMNYVDNFYPFRQDSTFLYFLGIDRPALAAIIDIDADEEILFGDDISVEQMVWTGYQPTLAEQAELAGIGQVKNSNKLFEVLETARKQNRTTHFLPFYRPEQAQKLSTLLGTGIESLSRMVSIPLIHAVVAQRSVKDAMELVEIEKAVDLTIDVQMAAMRYAKAGMSEANVAGRVHGLAISSGGNLSFPTILTVNGQILHNHYSNEVLRKGQLVLCDCGTETAMHYAGDLTRTFPVDKRFSTIQREVYLVVLNAIDTAVGLLRPGTFYRDIHLLACEELVKGLQQLGLMKGDVKEAVAAGAHALFFPCGLGHMMGLDVHDMENLGEEFVGYTEDFQKSTQFGLKSLRLGKKLEEGFVITVEPGLYFIPELMDQWKAEKKCTEFIQYDKLSSFTSLGGIRIEDDYVITQTGSRLLGKHLPKHPDEIELIREQAIG